MSTTEVQQTDKNRVQRGIAKRFVQVILTVGVQAGVLFLAAGRLNWWPAWAYVGMYLAGIAINAVFLLRYMPETVLMAVRTALEDRTLHEELEGYAAYARGGLSVGAGRVVAGRMRLTPFSC